MIIGVRSSGNRYPQLADEAWLRERYEQQEMTPRQIAEELGCAYPSVLRALRRYGIRIRGERPRSGDINEARLRMMYVDQSLSPSKIATILGCGRTKVVKALSDYEIPIRSLTQASHARWKVGEDAARKLASAEWLTEVYVNQGRPVDDIADELDVAHGSVINALDRYEIQRRNHKKAARLRARAARDGYDLRRRQSLQRLAKDAGEVGKAYTQVVQLLGRLDKVPYTGRDNSRLEREAMDGLYKAQDALAQRLLADSG